MTANLLPIIAATSWRRQQASADNSIKHTVSELLDKIEVDGDNAIDQLSLKFDGFTPQVIPLKEFNSYDISDDLKASIQEAAKRIEVFAKFQKEGLSSKNFTDEMGEYGQRITPIERAGCYIPGGRFPLISTALMTLIPAKVAGCSSRIAVSPSDHPALLAAASLAGATEFIQMGGIQAIGALAFGYQGRSPVDIVVGPGNAYVNEAKAQLQRTVKIDGLAGPSELMALCDSQQPIEWLAYDALAQSEHDPMAVSVLVSDNNDWLQQVAVYLLANKQFQQLIENQQIELIFADSPTEIISVANQFAAEHLMLCHENIEPDQLNHYGSLFIGSNSAVAMGDYCSGPNHTLPTLANARQTGGLNVQAFLRIQTIQKVSDSGRSRMATLAMPIAEAEGLDFHYQSLKVRL